MELHNVPYKVSYRAVKYPRLELKTGELLFVLPFGHNPDILLEKHKGWILKRISFIRECLDSAAGKELAVRTGEEFKRLVHSIANKTSKELKVELSGIYFRKMSTKWASMSSKGNMTINILMQSLPDHLVRYVIYHEMVHLIQKRHNGRFWATISRKYRNYKKVERDMFTYWFLIAKSHHLL